MTSPTSPTDIFNDKPAVDVAPPQAATLPTAVPHRVPTKIKIINFAAVVGPFLGLIAAMITFWGYGITWVDIGLLAGFYLITAVGITLGFHRLFTHRAFEAPRWVKGTLAILGSMAIEGPVLRWVATHRRHHQHSDDHDDPHSPHHHGDGFLGTLHGFWHAQVGWIFGSDPENLSKYVNDLNSDPMIRRISSLFPLFAILSFILPGILGGLITMSWWGAFLGFLWGGPVRVFLVHHVTWSINSVCHLWGAQPFNNDDHSRNNPVFGILGMGEGWHNNHHAFPTSARHGLEWWQFDLTYVIIRAMEIVGLAWKVKIPSQQALDAKRKSAA